MRMIRSRPALAAVLVLACGSLAPNPASAGPFVGGGCDCGWGFGDGVFGAWVSPYRPVTWPPSPDITAQEVRNRLTALGITLNPPPLALTPTPKDKPKQQDQKEEKEPDK